MVSKCLTALTTLAVIGGVVAAQQCGTVTATYGSHRQVVREVVVKKEVVIPVIAPVAVYAVVPTYAAVYVPPVAAAVAPAQPQPASEMSQVLQAIQGVHSKVDGLDARLKKLEAANDPDAPIPLPPANGPQLKPQVAAPAKPAGLTVLQGKCASCHEAAVAVNKGGGVTLFQGDQLAALSAQTKLDTILSTNTGSMPKRGGGREPLSDAEAASVVEFIKSLK